MKKLIILLLTLTLILGIFSSCGKRYLTVDDETSSSPSEDTPAESTMGDAIESNVISQTENTEDLVETPESKEVEYAEYYDFAEIDGQHYMVFNSYNIRPGPPADVNYLPPTFDSVEEFLNEWTNQTFASNVVSYIVRFFSRTENGIPIFDPNNFYVPSMPESWVLGYSDAEALTFLDGQCIAFVGACEEIGFLTVKVLGKELFENEFKSKEEDLELISSDQKEVYMQHETDSHHKYTMYVTEGDLYYIYVIRVREPLSHEQLLSFGLKKYER